MKNIFKKLVSAIILISTAFCSCKLPKTDTGQVRVHLDSLQTYSLSKQDIFLSNAYTLRFCSDFNNDTIMIFLVSGISHNIVATTDKSIALATSYRVKKDLGNNIDLVINNNIFSFKLNKNYLFIDIYYNRNRKTLDIHYSNNILVLS